MANTTSIEWTDLSWNPVHGCSKVSPGCAHCYAETLSLRYRQTLKPWTPENEAENVILKPHKLREPLSDAKAWRGLGAAAAAAGKTDGKLVFVNSMSDLFHEQVPDGFIAWVFWVMSECPQHTFQVLTKRPERMRDFMARWSDRLDRDENGEPEHRMALARGPEELRAKHSAGRAHLMADMLEQWGEPPAGSAYPTYDWMEGPVTWPDVPANVWLGVSIENRRYVGRADVLRDTPAAVRFISAEPLLGPLRFDHPAGKWLWADTLGGRWDGQPDLSLRDIDWLIVGGESGPGHRPMRVEWVRDLRDACLETATSLHEAGCRANGRQARPAFFFKQWGGATPKAGGRDLDGREWSEFPAQAAVLA